MFKRFDFVLAAALALSLVAFFVLCEMREQARQARLEELREARKAVDAQKEAARRGLLAREAARQQDRTRLGDELQAVKSDYIRAANVAYEEAVRCGSDAVAARDEYLHRNIPEQWGRLLALYAQHGVEPPRGLLRGEGVLPYAAPQRPIAP